MNDPRKEMQLNLDNWNRFEPGGVTFSVSIYRVKHSISFRGIRTVKETSEHKDGLGTYILASKCRHSSVVIFELAPCFGRLWHINHLYPYTNCNYWNTSIVATSCRGHLPCILYKRQDTEYPGAVDPLVNTEDLISDVVRNNSGRYLERIHMTSSMLIRFRSPDEISRITGVPVDSPLFIWYDEIITNNIQTSLTEFCRSLFVISNIGDMRISVLGNPPDSPVPYQVYINSSMNENESDNDQVVSAERHGLSALNLFIQNMVYPRNERSYISSIVLPFVAIDFSPNDMAIMGSDRFVNVIVPDSLPDRYYYPPVWNIMAGEQVRLPYRHVDSDSVNSVVFTPYGNSVPIEFFEFVSY